jgi:UPF0755 protein
MSLKKTSGSIVSITIRTAVYVLLVAILVYIAGKGYDFGKNVFSEKGYEDSPGTDITVTIYQGESKMQVAEQLVDLGVVGDKMVFYVQSLLYQADYIAGTYTINSSSSAEDIIMYLSEEHTEED